MYKKIEELYKKESTYNKLKIKMFKTYVIIVALLFLFNLFNSYFYMLLAVIATVLIMKHICEKELNINLFFTLSKNTNCKSLEEIIWEKDKKRFQAYLKKNKIYSSSILECIMEHYRKLIAPKSISDNFWSILAIIVSILLAFITEDGFEFNSFENALPYLICFMLVVIIFWLFVRQILKIKTIFKGEDELYERLEAIFSEMYIDSIKNREISKKQTRKKEHIRKYFV